MKNNIKRTTQQKQLRVMKNIQDKEYMIGVKIEDIARCFWFRSKSKTYQRSNEQQYGMQSSFSMDCIIDGNINQVVPLAFG